jgi:serine/threonine protein kinase/regulator of sirC expression with transglutaminase-like and TPR domain
MSLLPCRDEDPMADETRSAAPPRDTTASTSAAPRAADFVALKSGLEIRHYVIEEVIGAGGFGITYRARHERLKSKVFALKEFFPREFAARSGTHVISTRDGEGIFRWGLDRFLKEAEALAKCEHPSIVDVVDYFEENGTAYAVLGYIEGQQLGQWLDGLGRPPTQAELDRLIGPILDALEVVHRANLLHRDIAPDNILIRRDGSPCLIDFGACREDVRERSQKVSAIVKHGYSPPEQYHGIAELQGPWTDIYALGATLYRAVSGVSPMDSSRRGSLGDGLKPITEMTHTEYRPGFMAAIDMALRLKPDERPKSIGDWRPMLMSETAPVLDRDEKRRKDKPDDAREAEVRLVEGADSSSGKGGDATPAVTPARRGAVVIGAIAAIALAGMGALAFWRSPPPTPRPDPAPKPGPTIKPDLPTEAKSGPIAPVAPDSEQAAATAWTQIASTTDPTVIERFLELHGTTARASEARARLAALREDSRKADAAKAEAERAKQAAERAEAERQRAREAAWTACQGAPDAAKVAACARVIDSDDTAQRRAAALQIRGNAERKVGNFDKAIADLTRSLDLVPGQAQVLTDRGVAHFLKGGAAERQAALNDYDAALRVDPRHAEALNNRAWAVFQTGRAADALADANRSIEAVATNGYAYDTRGQILEALGRRDDAIRDYERAIQIDPSQETSRAGLQRLRGAKK